MPEPSLDAPASTDELYLARGDEIDECRPILSGDVFQGVPIAGLGDDPGIAIVVDHPCSMRLDGITLVDSMLVCRLSAHQLESGKGPWKKFGSMPLPSLVEGSDYVADFSMIGRAASAELSFDRRIASLSPVGIALLMQRLTNRMTRIIVPMADILKEIAHLIDEVDELENWSRAALEAGQGLQADEFHEFIREKRGGTKLQDCFGDAGRASGARRTIRKEIDKRFRQPKEAAGGGESGTMPTLDEQPSESGSAPDEVNPAEATILVKADGDGSNHPVISPNA